MTRSARAVQVNAAEVCRLRTRLLADADPQLLLDPRTDSERIFLFGGRHVAITVNSVKILHAVRSAITGIAELLVLSRAPLTQYNLKPFIM